MVFIYSLNSQPLLKKTAQKPNSAPVYTRINYFYELEDIVSSLEVSRQA